MNEAPPSFDEAFAAQLEQLLHWRRDVRHFDVRPVPEDDIQSVLHSASLAPSVGNSQPWRFVRLRSTELRAQLATHVDEQSALAAERYADAAQRDHYKSLKLHGLREAPEVMAVFCDGEPLAGKGLGIATMPQMLDYSVVMAIHTMWLVARVRGIGMGWVSIVDPEFVGRLVDAAPSWRLIALLCIGYPSEPAATPELEERGWQSREALAQRTFEK
ncbi:5,6-dimethylbenzimidazole synthase [Novosphingobium pentaromativorans]|uniref:Cob(II)yrinic acid a,c-diamide reductase n=1 Tax=Novosphingobium pentaromativorans US6-1 TaxID=1088721 RepID=G6E899_9SPHN|nr:5,6-dimethylbenzimidazole synthase [Novosphingobium pentaromativorans]AIT81410.1 cob(II)yrinic acid a,c-diamide reductase [Novosphingobium pentaromativorans US6-1]EHJ62439.1 cob(II)yrinic acid a,c-diamide reductase [Novosphingobium pentaromativorans US6-1]